MYVLTASCNMFMQNELLTVLQDIWPEFHSKHHVILHWYKLRWKQKLSD